MALADDLPDEAARLRAEAAGGHRLDARPVLSPRHCLPAAAPRRPRPGGRFAPGTGRNRRGLPNPAVAWPRPHDLSLKEPSDVCHGTTNRSRRVMQSDEPTRERIPATVGRRSTAGGGARADCELAAVGIVSFRAAMGHGPRRLLGERRQLGLLPARPGPQPRLSLGRRRAAGLHRPRVPALLRARAVERPRPDSRRSGCSA